MMQETMMCGVPMMLGMGLFLALLVVALVLAAAAAIKVLRSGPAAVGREQAADGPMEGR